MNIFSTRKENFKNVLQSYFVKNLKKKCIYLFAYFKNIFFCCQITKRSASYCIINNFEMNVFFYAECLNRQEAQQKKNV